MLVQFMTIFYRQSTEVESYKTEKFQKILKSSEISQHKKESNIGMVTTLNYRINVMNIFYWIITVHSRLNFIADNANLHFTFDSNANNQIYT